MTTSRTAIADLFTANTGEVRHAVYDALAARGPVHRIVLPHGGEGWLVTGYEAARALLADPRLVKGGPGHGPFIAELPPDIAAAIDHHLLSPRPARPHPAASAGVDRRSPAGASSGSRPRIQELTDELLDAAGRRTPRWT